MLLPSYWTPAVFNKEKKYPKKRQILECASSYEGPLNELGYESTFSKSWTVKIFSIFAQPLKDSFPQWHLCFRIWQKPSESHFQSQSYLELTTAFPLCLLGGKSDHWTFKFITHWNCLRLGLFGFHVSFFGKRKVFYTLSLLLKSCAVWWLKLAIFRKKKTCCKNLKNFWNCNKYFN